MCDRTYSENKDGYAMHDSQFEKHQQEMAMETIRMVVPRQVRWADGGESTESSLH